jgi:hypothetical protein
MDGVIAVIVFLFGAVLAVTGSILLIIQESVEQSLLGIGCFLLIIVWQLGLLVGRD